MLDPTTNLYRERLIAIARDIIADNPHARPDHLEVSLPEAGLTSLDTVKLVLGVEREFGVSIGPDDFDPANFETIDALEALVRRLAAA